MNDTKFDRRIWVLGALLAVLTFLAYARVTLNDFIVYDDPDYVKGNPVVQRGLTWNGLVWAFGATQASNYHPLTWVSHMLDMQLFGLNPAAHHLVNLLFHIANALLLFQVLRRMTADVWCSAFGAAFFAWHPQHVESVAWVAERKDVLSALFWLLTLLAYVRYVEKPGAGRYGVTMVLFALGLLSKPMVVTLPCVLLLLDFWPLKRLPCPAKAEGGWKATWSAPAGVATLKKFRQLCMEKLPFFALTVVFSILTVVAQKQGQAVASMDFLPLGARVANALVAYLEYILQMIWPSNLAVFYPLQFSQPLWKLASAAVLLAGVSWLALRRLREQPYLLVGWLWYLGTLVPVIGLVQVGDQALADRYTYIPFIGLGIMIAWSAQDLWASRPRLQWPIQLVALTALAAWIIVTGVQVTYWQNSWTLFNHACAVTANNTVAFNVLGNQLLEQNPPRIEEAKKLFLRVLALRPNDAGGHQCLGDAYLKEGRYDEAISQYCEAVRINPRQAEAHNALGVVLVRKQQYEEAIPHFTRAIQLNPNVLDPYFNLGLAFQNLGRLDEAAAVYRRTLNLSPNYKPALLGMGNVLIAQRQFSEAMAVFQQLLRVDPNSVDALNRLAWFLATHEDPQLRNGPEAVRLATRACELTGRHYPQSLNTLAAAYAETGRFDDAVQTAQQALTLAQASTNPALATIIQNLVKSYQNRQPYREVSKY